MAFSYEFKLGTAFPKGKKLFFNSWCDDAWGKVHSLPVKIATIKVGNKQGYIMTNGPCMPMTKGNLNLGDEIVSETIVGVAAADGENIPYDKPYCVFIES